MDGFGSKKPLPFFLPLTILTFHPKLFKRSIFSNPQRSYREIRPSLTFTNHSTAYHNDKESQRRYSIRTGTICQTQHHFRIATCYKLKEAQDALNRLDYKTAEELCTKASHFTTLLFENVLAEKKSSFVLKSPCWPAAHSYPPRPFPFFASDDRLKA